MNFFFFPVFFARIFFLGIFPCMNFFGLFPHPPHHFSNGPSLTNSTLKCLVDSGPVYKDECYLRWYFNNKSLPLKSTEKYETELKSHSKCKQAFILTILNVRDNDEGIYSCHMYCKWEEWKNTSASIELHVYPRQNGEKLFFSSNA